MYSLVAVTFALTSCAEEEGCTDSNALNYDSSAEKDDGTCVYETGDNDCITVAGEITTDQKWTSDNCYILSGRVSVTNGATLTIEPGTVIKAKYGAGSVSSALIVSREGMIMANGTASNPIVFTSVADDMESGDIVSPNMAPENNGLWGGIIILGKAPISASASEVQIEGIPTSDPNGLYGGSEPAHSSGEFSYVSIRHGGTNIGAGNEINGLTLGGVGTGTKIHHIEVVANQDDGIEWFGGTVNVSDVLIWNSGDDGLDTDQDWIGTCENFMVITPRGGSAFELDGPEGSGSASGVHTFMDGTVYAGEDIDHLIDWDGNTNAAVQNVYFYGLGESYAYMPASGDDDEFMPFESFGGDMSGTTSGIQITLNGGTLADLFANGDVPNGVSEVAEGAATVGADASEFSGWTWAAESGELSNIGQ